jgi:hypothetical protein
MKGILSVLVVLAAAPLAFGAYSSIQHNMLDTVNDTWYNQPGNLHKLTISSTTMTMTQNPDPGGTLIAPGATVFLETWWTGNIDPTRGALFTGGTFSLTFDYDPGSGTQSYDISGPISGLFIKVTSTGASSIVEGEGLFDAVTKTLPDVWDDSGGLSSIDSWTIAINQNLSTFSWDADAFTGQTNYTIFPDERAAPEPMTLAMLACGSLLLLRRRRV